MGELRSEGFQNRKNAQSLNPISLLINFTFGTTPRRETPFFTLLFTPSLHNFLRTLSLHPSAHPLAGVLWNPVVDLPAMLAATDIPEW